MGSMNRFATWIALGLAGLAGCQKILPLTPPAPTVRPAPSFSTEIAPAERTAPMNNIGDYKMLVAEQILAANPAFIFSGRLPPMLPAIVVVNISIDKNGELIKVVVKRSRDTDASKVALEAVKRVDLPFPKPLHLLHRSHKTLDFSETFLFNDQYQFQLRTLAGPQ